MASINYNPNTATGNPDNQTTTDVILGDLDQSTVYVWDGSEWELLEGYEKFKIKKKQNQVSEFSITLPDVEAGQKVYIKEYAEVLFFSGISLILKGRIQKVTYKDAYECEITGYGMEAVLLDKEFIKAGDKRVQYTNESAQTIAEELLSENSDGSTPWVMTPDTAGIFSTDYGSISMRYEYANRLSAIAKLAEAMDYEWDVTSTSASDYHDDFFQLAPLLPTTTQATVSQETFTVSGSTANCAQTANEKDISNLANKIDCLGYGDGVNQAKTSTYNASATWSTLSASISDSATTISLTDASSFPTSGEIRIMEERISYSGKSGNDLTGCVRTAEDVTPFTKPLEHKKGVFVEKYVAIASAETGSSIDDYGLSDYTLIQREILDVATLELLASRELIKRLEPIQRINITPDDAEDVVKDLNIGDLVTIDDAEADLDDDFRIVGIEFASYYGDLQINLECSNRTLTFIEQMTKQRQEAEALGKYMQGSTNIYAISEAENCDATHPLNMRFFVPNEAIAINKVLLNFKLEDYRAYSSGTTGAPESQINSAMWSSNSIASITKFTGLGWATSIPYNLSWSSSNRITSSGETTTADQNWSLPHDHSYHRWVYSDGDSTPDSWTDLATEWGLIATAATPITSKRFLVANSFGTTSTIDSFSTRNDILKATTITTSPTTWPNPVYTDAVAANLTGTFDKIRVSFTVHNGTKSSDSCTIRLKRSPDQATPSWTTVGTWNHTFGIGEHYHQQYEDSTDYRGYLYRLEVSDLNVNADYDTSWFILNVGTYLSSGVQLIYGIEEETLTSPSVDLNIQEDGQSISLFDTYTSDQIEVDITEEVRGIGAGKWVQLQFDPNKNMRIEANSYIQIFIESK